MSTNNIWPPPAYDGKVRFEVWEAQLDMYMTAKSITAASDKVLALLQNIGMEMFEKLMDWCYPKKPKELTYAELVKLIKDQCSSFPNVFARRVRLFNEKQQPNQSVQEYFAHMRQLLGQCEMKTMTPQEYGVLAALRGLQSDELKQFLMNPANDISDMEKAQALAVSYDQSRSAAKDIAQGESRSKPFGINVVGKGYKCGYCGGAHLKGKDNCPAKGAVCNKCGRKDHFAKVCKSGRKQYQNFVEDDTESLNGIYPYSVLTVSSNLDEKEVSPIKVAAKLDGVTVNFQYDTGAAVTVISKKVWHSIGKPRMQLSRVQLKSYNKIIPVIGQCKVFVECERQIKQQWIIVFSKGESLFGRNWIKAFNFLTERQNNAFVNRRRPGSTSFMQNKVTVSYPTDRREDMPCHRQTSKLQKKFIEFDEMHGPMQGKEMGGSDVDRKQREARFLNQKTAKRFPGVTVLKKLKLQNLKPSISDEDKEWRKSAKLDSRNTKQEKHTRKPCKLQQKDTVASSESISLREGVVEGFCIIT